MERSRFYWEVLPISVYFWSLGSYLFYNAIGTQKIAKNYLVFSSKWGNLLSSFMLWTATAIIMQEKSFEISPTSIHSVIKRNFYHLSVCLHNAQPQRRQMTSHNFTLLTLLALYCIASNQNRNAVSWHVLYFTKQINTIFMIPIYDADMLCHCIVKFCLEFCCCQMYFFRFYKKFTKATYTQKLHKCLFFKCS